MAESSLDVSDEHELAAHLAMCAACRDDAADPLSRALVQTTIEMALPPPDFTAKLMQRLPHASPLELARQEARHQQRRRQRFGALGVAGVAVLGLIGLVLQPVWAGTSLGFGTAVVRTVAAAAVVPLLMLLASAAVVALLLQIVARRPQPGTALGAAAIAGLLLLSSGVVVNLHDRSQVSRPTQVATVLRSIQTTDDVRGDVVSLLGDIQVGSTVGGDVGSLFGGVTLQPRANVAGDVLVGSGSVVAAPGQVAGQIQQGSTATAFGAAWLLEQGEQSLSPSLARSLASLLGALVTLALAGLVVLLWPQRIARTSSVLPHKPWTALGLGLLITVLLALLALPVMALLALTVVGLLVVPIVLMLVHLPYVQGLAAVGQALGQRLTGRVTVSSALWGVAAQLVLVLLLGTFAPLAGLCAFYLLASLGLGAQVLDRAT